MPFRVCYYHVIWATKHRAPLITPEIESFIISTIERKSTEMNSPILALNSVADHIHVAVSISTSVAASQWIKQIKGVSAHDVNIEFPHLSTHFRWQQGYDVLTFGAKNLPFVTDYIARQKEHHNNNTFETYLERTDG